MHTQSYSGQAFSQGPQRQEVTLSSCKHDKIFKSSNAIDNCQDCGSVVFSNGVKSYKTTNMKFESFIDTQKHYEAMIQKKLPLFKLKTDTPYFKCRNELIKFINETANFLNISINTRHLAVFFLDYTFHQKPFSASHYDLFAATALMLAAKTMELDERIPFISRLRKYSGLNYRTEEFRRAEQSLIEALEWNLQHCTLIDIIEFYMAQGVLYSNDILDNSGERKRGSLGTTLQESKTFNTNTAPQVVSPSSHFDPVTKEVRHSDSNSKQKGKENSSNIKTLFKDSLDTIAQAVSNLYVSDITGHSCSALEKKANPHPHIVSHYEIERKPAIRCKAATCEKIGESEGICFERNHLFTSDFKVSEPHVNAAPERKSEVAVPHVCLEEFKANEGDEAVFGENEGPLPPEADPEDEDGRPFWNAARERAEEIPEAPMAREEDDLEIGDEKEEFNFVRNLEAGELLELLQKIQTNAISLSNEIVMDASFVELDKKYLAAACIAYLRKSVGVMNYWNPELALISGLSKYDFETYVSKLESTFGSSFSSYLEKKAARASDKGAGFSGGKQASYPNMNIPQNYYEIQPILMRPDIQPQTFIQGYPKLQTSTTTSFLSHPGNPSGSFYQHPFQKSFSLGGEYLGFGREEKAYL